LEDKEEKTSEMEIEKKRTIRKKIKKSRQDILVHKKMRRKKRKGPYLVRS